MKKWTEEDLDVAHARVLAGVTVRQIAAERNVNQTSLGRLLKRRFAYAPTPYRRPTLTIPDDVAVRAYIAGIIDGEGSIPFLNNHWCVKVAMTDEPVIRWLHAFGAHLEVRDRTTQLKVDGTPKKRVYCWQVHRRHDVVHLLTAIFPYLIVKRERAQHVLSLYSDAWDE